MQLKIGQIVEGTVTGIQPYGAFVFLDEKTSGLIHISEISDGYVKDVKNFVNVKDHVRVKVIDIDENGSHARLSLKALQHSTLRKDKQRQKKAYLPVMKIGFQSIADAMPQWIQEAKEKTHD